MSLIVCEKLTREYRRGENVIVPLNELDLTVEAGTFLALMGPSGSGKTTLLNLIAGIDRPTAGQLTIDATNVAALSRSQLARWRCINVGYIFQLYNLVPTLTAYENVELFAARRLDLEIVAMSEPAYYAQVAAFYRPIQLMTLATAALIGIGGLFGGLNTLYAAFAARVREFATLQTLGFPRRAIVLSLVQEAVLTTAAGGLLAAVVASITLDGMAVRFAMGAVGLQIDSYVLMIGLTTAIALGLVGALPPAIACLHLPITTALKAV